MLQVEWRMMAIPLLFVFLRIWGTLQFVFSLTQPASSCILPSIRTVFVILGILQVCCHVLTWDIANVLSCTCAVQYQLSVGLLF